MFLYSPFLNYSVTQDLFYSIDKTLSNKNITINDAEVIITIDVPGMSKDDIKLKIKDYTLSIIGEKGDRYVKRQYLLTEDLAQDKVSAICRDGILTITIPKKQPDSEREININIE